MSIGWVHGHSYPHQILTKSSFCSFKNRLFNYLSYGISYCVEKKIQFLIVLSTVEAEYSTLREVVDIVPLLEDLTKQGLPIINNIPVFKCRIFEDNMSCIKLTTNHHTLPRKKYCQSCPGNILYFHKVTKNQRFSPIIK